MTEERRFFIDAIRNGSYAYSSDDFVMPVLPELSKESIAKKAELDYKKWSSQANEFWLGAQYYQERKIYNLAAFCMHQAIESGFIALISSVLGYKLHVHNLSRMLRITLMFTDEIKQVFRLDTQEGVQLFELLREAYSKTRYSSSYQLDKAVVDSLTKIIPEFLGTAEKVYKDFIDSIEGQEHLSPIPPSGL
ncbi:HEPN domain-containing protein [Mucilaginibacter psychrotolerans]|uniref:HEPN domain-containing protein n=1 Tax=Mucilaginibacter psychrotolerans TaxID=1524096 RepID=A0A4Y8SI10_9SPHI|nr:HEPN domain-containing protein [Mucilaginibacter psychrotolerans]TFF38502.1 HEPN domain-containing protein [Mucilaginibacter psychrotolerans]